MKLRTPFNKFLITGISVGLLAFIFLTTAFYKQTQHVNKTAALIAHAEEELYDASNILSDITSNEAAARGFILTGKGSFLQAMQTSKENIRAQMDSLQDLKSNNAGESKKFSPLKIQIARLINFTDSTVALKKEKGTDAATQLMNTERGISYMAGISSIIHDMQREAISMEHENKAANVKAIYNEKILRFATIMVILSLMLIVFWKEQQWIEEKAQRKIQEQMALLSLQINQSHDAIYTLDTDRKITSWNHGAENLYGFTKEEAIGKDTVELLNTDITQEEITLALIEVAEHDYWSGELRRTTKSGNKIYVHASTTNIRDENKKINGYVAVSHDITDQKKLYEQINHLANIVEQSSEAILSRDSNQRIISWNKGAEKLFGFTKKEAIGKTALELDFIKLSAQEIAAIEKQITDTGSWKDDTYFYRKDGSRFFGTVTANLIKNDTANSFYFIVKDISARKQLEEKLEQINEELEIKVLERSKDILDSEKKYRYLFEINPLPMWVIDTKDFRFLAVNEKAIERYGFSREEFLSMSAADIRPKADRAAFINIERSRQANPQIKYMGVWNHLKKDGSVIQVEVHAHQIDYENKSAALVLANDVTEREKIQQQLASSEKRFRSLIENNYDVITLLDANFKVFYRSPSAQRITGWSDEEMFQSDGENKMAIHPDDRPKADVIMKECIASPGKPVYAIYRNLHKDGHYIWLEGAVTNLLDHEYINAIVFNFRDVTDRIEAEEKIKELNTTLEEKITQRTKQLKKSNEELEAFSYSVSHDLRAPLRAIIGYSNMLVEDYGETLDEEAKRITDVIKSNTLKMGTLIDDLLTFSRTGRHELSTNRINTAKMVNEIIDSEKHSANGSKKITWTLHELPEIKADPGTIRQVWMNLLTNAIKYSGKVEAPEIEIGSFKQGVQNVFYVRDNGVGFNEKYKNKLFKVFQRLHSDDEFPGTGIGLAIVEKIVSKHGGNVWAEADVDKGACFYFSLPEADGKLKVEG